MTDANVIALSSRRRPPEPTETCPCRPEWECYSHRVKRASNLLRVHLAVTEGELLIDRSETAVTLGDVVTLLDGITAEAMPRDGREVR